MVYECTAWPGNHGRSKESTPRMIEYPFALLAEELGASPGKKREA
jgi:hypothetical protein